jgi:hypothetical protein
VNNSPAETVVRTADLHNCIGIDGFVVCTAPEFDDLIREIRGWKPIAAPVTPLVRRATNTLEE